MSFWDRLVEEARSLGELSLEWAILIGVALLVLIIGRWIARLIRNIVVRLMDAKVLDNVWKRSGVTKALENSEQTAASITGTIVYAYLLVVVVLIAVRVLRLDTIHALLSDFLVWIPQLLLAVIVVLVAAAVANWTRELVKPFADSNNVGWLATAVYLAVIVVGILFALDIVEITFAEDVVKILITAFAVALAIAFGVGGIDTAKLWWAKHGTPTAISGGGSGGDTKPPSSEY